MRAIPILAAALCACAAPEPRLEYGEVRSEILDEELGFSVLRAPAAPDVDPRDLPIVVLLHGMGDDHRSLDRFGLSARLLDAMESGRVPRAHLSMPDGERGFYTNWHDGSHPYEDYILEEVLPAAEALLGVRPTRERRVILGVSMGGGGALQIGMRHPELFGGCGSLSGLLLDEADAKRLLRTSRMRFFVDLERVFSDGSDQEFFDAHNIYEIAERRKAAFDQRIFLAAGSREDPEFLRTTKHFRDHLAALGIDHVFTEYDGGHGWRYWAPVIEEALRVLLDRGNL
ncbi:MAG: esterase family protein [Proteobacteria bacterium]|jgi:S-formylglutathione hydrolase FrmB|nr:esterase family protein [Pseudomonadota bacterium]